jgi:hypothetical protein
LVCVLRPKGFIKLKLNVWNVHRISSCCMRTQDFEFHGTRGTQFLV